jgi:hypothetical protein
VERGQIGLHDQQAVGRSLTSHSARSQGVERIGATHLLVSSSRSSIGQNWVISLPLMSTWL